MSRLFNLLIVSSLISIVSCNPYPDFQKHDGGLYSKFHRKNGGATPRVTDIAVVDLLYRTKDSIFYDSRTTGSPINLTINKPDYRGDLNTALQMMAAGDSATFILKADSFFIKTLKYNRLPKGIQPGEVLFLEARLHRFYTQYARNEEIKKWKLGLKSKEASIIKEYLASHNLSPDTTASGLMIVKESAGKGSSPQKGDKMKVNMSLSLLNGKLIYSSTQQGKPLLFEFGRTIENRGVEEALSLMSEGARFQVIIPSALAFGEEGRGEFIPPFTPVVYHIEMIDIITKAEEGAFLKEKALKAKQNEIAERERYLSANNMKIKPTASGLYFLELKKGTGDFPKSGEKVKVHYSGFLTDGRQFDSSLDRALPFEFEVGKGSVIKGWDEAIRMMKKGSKAKIVVPSSLGYGERGSGEKIGPYATLVFEIELLDIKHR